MSVGGVLASVPFLSRVTSAASPDIFIRPARCVRLSSRVTDDAADDLAQQINDRTDAKAEVGSTVRVPHDTLQADRNYVSDPEEEIFRNAVDYIADNSTLVDNDHVIVGHEQATLGWGGGPYHYECYDDGTYKSAYGGVHQCTVGGYYPARNSGMQEILHSRPWDGGHGDGQISLNASFYVDGVSPIATSYVYDGNGTCDTEVCGGSKDIPSCGGGHVPDNLCHRSNREIPFAGNCPIHTKRISDCLVTATNNNALGFSSR